jgi:predicted nucleic acid-binding protein
MVKLQKCFALDANILFDLAEDQDYAHTLREVLQERGAVLQVPPTVIQELVFAAQALRGKHDQIAFRALGSMRDWNLVPIELAPVQHGIAREFVRRLIRRGYLPQTEENDGLILAETSLAQTPVLLTRDQHLLDIPAGALMAEINESHLCQLQIMHPKLLLRALKPARY